MSQAPYPHLAEPIMIGKLKLANRLTVAPMIHNLAGEDGTVTERLIDAYRKKGAGGWAVVMVEASQVSEDYSQFNRMLGVHHGRYMAGLTELADAVKEGGSLAGIQLMHPGGMAPSTWNTKQPVSPSGIKMTKVEPRQMGESDIDKAMNEYASAAVRAKRAGFDLVQLHGAHGFLIHQFMSPYFNKRDDKYGDYSAFPTELIHRVRDAVGPHYPISMRISGAEFLGEGDADIRHMTRLAPLLEEAGLDCLDISAGSSAGSGHWIAQPVYYDRGCITHLAEEFKKVVNIPVVTAGRINNPKLAEKIIADGKADIVSMGRGSLADPELPKKALSGNIKDIRECTACYIGCASVGARGTLCTVNYEVGRWKSEYEILPALKPKKVMVVGGGIAGMEAARIAKLRGHEVQLYERDEVLGGIARSMAGKIPKVNTGDIKLSVQWQKRQLDDLGVPVSLKTDVNAELVKKEKPEAVILATGSLSALPDIPGIDNGNVLTVDDYLIHKKDTGEKVVVIGGHHGSEVALSLARKGKQVTIIEQGKSIALAPYLLTRRQVLIAYLKEAGVKILTLAGVKEINSDGVTVIDKEGNETNIETDSILMALERQPDNTLENELKGLVRGIYKVGDCDKPLHTLHAFHSANRVARLI